MRFTIRFWVVAALEMWHAAYLQNQAQSELQTAADVSKGTDQDAALLRRPVNAQTSLLRASKPRTMKRSPLMPINRA